MFGRTDREKEDWFRRLKAATHKGANASLNESYVEDTSQTLLQKALNETDYIKYMTILTRTVESKVVSFFRLFCFKGAKKHPLTPNTSLSFSGEIKTEFSPEDGSLMDAFSFHSSHQEVSIFILFQTNQESGNQWINAFLGRILFDCLRDDNFTQSVKDKIQRKLSSIKLPYFIEGLMVTELNLGQTPPIIHNSSKPIVDERGLWIDLDITYEGLVVLILQTKLNLMKLKQPHATGKYKSRWHTCYQNHKVTK